MMQIVYFSRKEQFLIHMDSHPGEKVFITPSPAKADGLRERLKGSVVQDVITIARFTSNLLLELSSENDTSEVKRKSELLLVFGILKNKYLPELGYEQFTQAYNLFSDLRSFTMNQEALTAVLEEQPAEIRKAVNLFWQLLQITGYLDEHGAYQKIAELLRFSEEKETLQKTYIFWGFQHLNGQQVDLLKALSIRYDVIIPFPFSLKERLKRSDWVSWIKDSNTKEVLLPEIPESPEADWIPVNSRELSIKLKEILKTGDQILLGVSKLSPLHLDFVPSLLVGYKVPFQLVDAELKEIGRDLKLLPPGLSHEELLAELKGRKTKNLKQFRAVQLYLEALSSISKMTDEKVKIDTFFLKLLAEVTGLNQPRTSFVPMRRENFEIELKDMSSLEHLDRDRRVVLCIDERFEDIQSLAQNYTESVQKALGALGPLKRNELELLFKQWEFRDLFSRGKVIVLMGKETLKHNLIWKRLFANIKISPVGDKSELSERKVKDHFAFLEKKQFDGGFSASKLQSYIDCPRRFYFSYVDRTFPEVKLEKDFDPLTSGIIVHEIIEKFHKLGLQDRELGKLVWDTMQFYVRKNNLALSGETWLQNEVMFNHRSLNGIQYVRDLTAALGVPIDWEFEREFALDSSLVIRGKIDCVGTGGEYLFLLDFKSSNSASGKEVENLENIQLWTYAHAAKSMFQDFSSRKVVMGFVLLDNPAKSRLFCDDKEFAKSLKSTGLVGSVHVFNNSFTETLSIAEEKMISLSLDISRDQTFQGKPRDPQKCNFCELNKLCVKSELENV